MKTGFSSAAEQLEGENSANQMKQSTCRVALGAALLGLLTASAGCVYEQRHAIVYAEPPPVYAHSTISIADDYVYYPAYEIYYSSNQRQYIYRDGHSWVSRPTPPRVSAEVLFAAPSVRLGFHDSPAIHHAAIVRQYPKHWAPPGQSRGNEEGREGRGGGNRKGKEEQNAQR